MERYHEARRQRAELGGSLVPRSAAKGFPFKAVVANSIIPDVRRSWRRMPNTERLAEWESTWKMNVTEPRFDRKLGPGLKATEHGEWTWGVETIKAPLEQNAEFEFDPGALDLPVHVLCTESKEDVLCAESKEDVYPEIRERHDRALDG